MDANQYLEDHWEKKKVWNCLRGPKHKARLKQITMYLPKQGKYLDVGCAYGHSTVAMAAHVGGVEKWMGVDFAPGVRRSRHHNPKLVTLYIPKVAHLSGYVVARHGVVCSEVIEHVKDDHELIEQLLYVTRPGGTIVITTPNIEVKDPGHLRLYTEDMLHKLMVGKNKVKKYTIKNHGPFFFLLIKKEPKERPDALREWPMQAK